MDRNNRENKALPKTPNRKKVFQSSGNIDKNKNWLDRANKIMGVIHGRKILGYQSTEAVKKTRFKRMKYLIMK